MQVHDGLFLGDIVINNDPEKLHLLRHSACVGSAQLLPKIRHLEDGTLGFQKGFPAYCQRVWDLCATAAQRALLAFGVALGLEEPATFEAELRFREPIFLVNDEG